MALSQSGSAYRARISGIYWAESRIKGNTSTFIGVVMTKHFEQLSAEERATIMVMVQEGQS
ncbi:MAG: hypothetical protein WAT36_13955, partial [Chromatiaceae bacterium]